MAKIVLGKRPQKIFRTIKFKLVDGTDGFLGVDYKYRTRSEYGAFVDELNVRAQKVADSMVESITAGALPDVQDVSNNGADSTVEMTGVDALPSYQDLLDKGAEANVEFLLDALEGWNLDAPFGREAVEQLVDEYPQAALEIINTYRLACTEGRLGN